jgi:tRNA uridine 5-carboxymethylaminomethyl modification enzyme
MGCSFEVIVIGGGHAGAEAAWACARLGVPTLMVTMDPAAIGRMSCNPAIGGIGKGQMVREIDALGGLMGLATDEAGIQFRMLNRRKGPAVWAPRAQCDRVLYATAVQRLLVQTPNLTITGGRVESFETRPLTGVGAGHGVATHRITGVRLADGRRFGCRCVVVTTGTFLRALMHTGEHRAAGGRIGEASADGLSEQLRAMGFELGRLKTGTPPRVARDTVEYGGLEEQPGDDRPLPFSFMNDGIANRQVSCWITYTEESVHELIRANLHRAPMYSGQIQSRGPRYCPSIEDKVVRFADKPRHQLFLEPEGYDSDRIYCNGISTSLPADVQEEMVRRIAGLERARIVQHGYSVEYDFVPPEQTRATLETKRVEGLYLAGQINGTSGYEEAAGQGIVAGVNASRRVSGGDPLVLRRDESYIGVMIDDLVTKGTSEPYRMFTSRAEYRLLLRSDSADARLTPIGRRMGLVDDARWGRFETKQRVMRGLSSAKGAVPAEGGSASWQGLIEPAMRIDESAWRSGLPTALREVGGPLLREAVVARLIEEKYEGYVRRQLREVERFSKQEARSIPDGFDFAGIPHLRHEAREKFAAVGPRSLGQAQRISGISPADVAVLMVYLDARRGAAAGVERSAAGRG